ncbi:MAG: UDP-3-O-[3-hydroxymyristoyl] N-acetylglucosamine deacetylase [Elusimicrobia bacterium]|nr:UDP-3-O-[3-hydroxymyristoyl] N-acetylglucosamine deacetylase [Elusimicrobiota bacterium]
MRKTIAKKFSLEGIGLHKGERSFLTVFPLIEPCGIRFLYEGEIIEADIKNLTSTVRGTNLGTGGNIVYTVEHLLSAFFALGIDDAEIKTEGCEPPAMDGSALPFAKLILNCAIKEKNQNSKPSFSVSKKISFSHKDSFYEIAPSQDFELEVIYENSHPMIGKQRFLAKINPDTYIAEIAPARTFGFKHEIEYLRKNNLALGGTLDNAVVLDEKGILNPSGLRFKDEFVRHKALDLLGDLSLTGFKFEKVKISANRPSHEANAYFAKFLKEMK